LLHLVGYLYYWQMGFNSVFKGLTCCAFQCNVEPTCSQNCRRSSECFWTKELRRWSDILRSSNTIKKGYSGLVHQISQTSRKPRIPLRCCLAYYCHWFCFTHAISYVNKNSSELKPKRIPERANMFLTYFLLRMSSKKDTLHGQCNWLCLIIWH